MAGQIKTPNNLIGFMVYIDGHPQGGLVTEGTPPKIVAKTEEYQNAGMMQPQDAFLGYELQEVEFTFNDVAVQMDKHVGNTIELAFYGGFGETEDDVKEAEIRITGRIKEIDRGSFKQAEKTEVKIKLTVKFYKYVYDGVIVHEFDPTNGIFKIDGQDQMASLRSAIFK